MITPAPAAVSPRVLYHEGQVLRAADLRTEQAYRLDARWRHDVRCHSGGVVAGLVLQSLGDSLALGPGMALDAYGREIFVASPRRIDADALKNAQMQLGLPAAGPVALDLLLTLADAPRDAQDANTPAAPPDRYTENYCIVYTDPQLGWASRDDRVFLGTASGTATKSGDKSGAPTWTWEIHDSERRYVQAHGARVVGASGAARMLLAPLGPEDLRRFAVGFLDSLTETYSDCLTVNADQTIRVKGATSVSPGNNASGPAVLAVARRRVGFQMGELARPGALLARVLAAVNATSGGEYALLQALRPEEQGRLRAADPSRPLSHRDLRTLQRMLNRAIANWLLLPADTDPITKRGETARLLLAYRAGSPRGADVFRLRRLLLEDLFPSELKRLPTVYDGPLGVAFAWPPLPAPKAARPGCIYQAAVTDNGRTFQQLRIEFSGPDKQGDPANFRCDIGAEGRRGIDGKPLPFAPALRVAADQSVTVFGKLTVPTGAGQLIQTTPTNDPNDAISQARLIAAVAPWDLNVQVKSVQATTKASDANPSTLVIVSVSNTGQAPVVAVQINGSAINLKNPAMNINFLVARGVTLAPNAPRDYPVPLNPFDATANGNSKVHINLTVVGVGPANNVLQATFQGDVQVTP